MCRLEESATQRRSLDGQESEAGQGVVPPALANHHCIFFLLFSFFFRLRSLTRHASQHLNQEEQERGLEQEQGASGGEGAEDGIGGEAERLA